MANNFKTTTSFAALDLVTPAAELRHFTFAADRKKFSVPVRVHLLYVDGVGLPWVREAATGRVYPANSEYLRRVYSPRR